MVWGFGNIELDAFGDVVGLDIKRTITARSRKASKGNYRYIAETYDVSTAKKSEGLDC